MDADSDGDGLDDGEEINRHGTDPNSADTDGDGLADGEEINQYGTDPNSADTDDDGYDDNNEIIEGTNPTDPEDSPSDSDSPPSDDNSPPTADFSWSPTNPSVGETITFEASSSSDSDGRISEYRWDFDDDGTIEKTGESVSNTRTSPGEYTVTLTVIDNDDAMNTTTQKIPAEPELSGFITGSITDTTGNPINSPVKYSIMNSTTDEVVTSGNTTNGEYTATVPPGSYRIVISSSEYDDFVITRDVKTDATTTVDAVLEPTDEFEPNNDFETAASITEGRYSSLQADGGESDYFAITLDQGYSIDVSIDFNHTDGNLEMEFYNPDQQVVEDSFSTTNNETVSINSVSESGTYYIHVNSSSEMLVPYNLTATVGPDENNVVRTINDTSAAPGDSVEVTIDAQLNDKQEFTVVDEINPGPTDVEVTGSDSFRLVESESDAVIGLSSGTDSASLVYEVTIPEGANNGETFTFSGAVDDSSTPDEIDITGDSEVTVNTTDRSESIQLRTIDAPQTIQPATTFTVTYAIENIGGNTTAYTIEGIGGEPNVTITDFSGDILSSNLDRTRPSATTNGVGAGETTSVTVEYQVAATATGTVTLDTTVRDPLTGATSSLSQNVSITQVPEDPTQRALQITGRENPDALTQSDVTAAITRFSRGQSVNGIEIKQDDITAIVTFFERD
ncbi:hypothetical protein DJ69_00690 [Halorubrum persicum]|uniref:PKD domain-containing protein n=2 Tax=Halorubrum persicum TaxID=1383844 RepID=A0A2G1WNF4_9EURY|nr:hypothetical protein DJ69_00690 [Halorubrum persicum]